MWSGASILALFVLAGTCCAQIPITSCGLSFAIGESYYLASDIIISSQGSPCFTCASAYTFELDGRGFKIIYQPMGDDYNAISVADTCYLATFKNIEIVNAGMAISGSSIDIINVTIAASGNTKGIEGTGYMTNLFISDSNVVAGLQAISITQILNLTVQNTYLSGSSGLVAGTVNGGRIIGNIFYKVTATAGFYTGIQISQVNGDVLIQSNTITTSPNSEGVGMELQCMPSGVLVVRDNYVTTKYIAKGQTKRYYSYELKGCKTFQFVNNTADKIGVNVELASPTPYTPIYGGIYVVNSDGVIDKCQVSLVPSEVPDFTNTNYGYGIPQAVFGIYLDQSTVAISNSNIHDIIAPTRAAYADIVELPGVAAAGIYIDTLSVATTVTDTRIVGVYGGEAGKEYAPTGSAGPYELTGGNAYGIRWEHGDLTLDGIQIDSVIGGNGIRVDLFTAQCEGGKGFYWSEYSGASLNLISEDGLTNVRNGSDCAQPSSDININACGSYGALINAKVNLGGDLAFTTNCIRIPFASNTTFYGNGYAMACSGVECSTVYGFFLQEAQNVTFVDLVTQGVGAVFTTLSGGSVNVTNGRFKGGLQHIFVDQASPTSLGKAFVSGCQFYNASYSGVQVAARNGDHFYWSEVRNNYFQDMHSTAITVDAVASFITGNTIINGGGTAIQVKANYGATSYNTISGGGQYANVFYLQFDSAEDNYRDVSNNQVENLNHETVTSFSGLFVQGLPSSGNITIANNVIRNITLSCASTISGITVIAANSVLTNNTVQDFITNSESYNCDDINNPLVSAYAILFSCDVTMVNCDASNIHGLPTRAISQYVNPYNMDVNTYVQALYIVAGPHVTISDSHFDKFYGPNMPGCSNCSSASAAGVAFGTVMSSLASLPYANTSLVVNNVEVTNFYGGKGGDILDYAGNGNSLGGDVLGFYNLDNATVIVSNSIFDNFVAGVQGLYPGAQLPCTTGRADYYNGKGGTAPILDNVTFTNFFGSKACKQVEGCGAYRYNDTFLVQTAVINRDSSAPVEDCILITNSKNVKYIGFYNALSSTQGSDTIIGITVKNSENVEVTQVNMNDFGFAITESEAVTLSSSVIKGGGISVRIVDGIVGSASIANNIFVQPAAKYCINATSVTNIVISDNNCGDNAGVHVRATGIFDVRNNTVISSNDFALELTGASGIVQENQLPAGNSSGIYVHFAGLDTNAVSIVSDNVVSNIALTNKAGFYGLQLQCDDQQHVKVTNNMVQDIQIDQTIGEVAGISTSQCYVEFDSNSVIGLSQVDSGHSQPMNFIGYKFQAATGTVKRSEVSNINHNSNFGASVIDGLTAFGFLVQGGSLSMNDITVINVTVFATPNCTDCHDASGTGAVGFYVNAAHVDVNGLLIDGLRAGNGGGITITVSSGDYLSLGGDVSAVWVADSASDVQIGNAQYRNFKAGNGGYFDNANSTTCAGGKANLKYADCYECGNRITFQGTLVYNLNGASGLSCLGDASSTTAIWPMDTSTLTTTTTTTTSTATTTGTTTDTTTTITITDTTTTDTTADTTTDEATTYATSTTGALDATTSIAVATTITTTEGDTSTTTSTAAATTTTTADTTSITTSTADTTTASTNPANIITTTTDTTTISDPTTASTTTNPTSATTGSSTTGGGLPTRPTVLSITKKRTTITLVLAPPFTSEPLTYAVGYSTNMASWNASNNASGLLHTIVNLTPNTTYYVRVAAIGSDGVSPFVIVNTSTDPLSVPAEPLKPTSSSFDRSYINVVWTQPDDGGLPILEYTLQVLNTSGNWFTLLKNKSNSYRLDGLAISTSYQFRVAASNSMGYGNFSVIAELSTAQRECGDGICDSGFETCGSCYLDCFKTCAPNNNCPGAPTCSGRGTCNNGVCACTVGWSGSSCDLEDVPVIIVINTSSPVTSAAVANRTDVNFIVSFHDIHEQSVAGSIVGKRYLFSEQNFTVAIVNSTVPYENTTVYTATLSNNAVVSIYVSTFSNNTKVSFANHNISVSANGFKYAMKVENWPFEAYGDKLIVTMDSSGASRDPEDDCVIVDTSNDANSLRWLKVTVNGVVLYGKFADYALIDNVEKVVQFSYDKPSKLVEIIIPHFWNNAAFDPDFQVLLSKDDYDSGCISHSNKLNGGKIAGIAVGVVVGVALIVAAIGFAYFRQRKMKTKKRLTSKLQSSASTNNEMKLLSSPSL